MSSCICISIAQSQSLCRSLMLRRAGHDDAFALLVAATHPRLHLLGVSTVHGNASVGNVTHNARAVLHLLQQPQVRVIEGAAAPRAGPKQGAQRFHGESGMAGVTLLPPAPAPPAAAAPTSGPAAGASRAALAMRDALRSVPAGTAWIVAVGALTNVAELVRAWPEAAARVAGVSVMGGAVGGDYAVNDGVARQRWLGKAGDSSLGVRTVEFPTPWAEFNVWSDPEAADTVFGADALRGKITAVMLDLTYQVLATQDVFGRLFADEGGLVRRVFLQVLEHSRSAYGGYYDHLPGPPLHDPLAVAVVLEGIEQGLKFEDGERLAVRVVTEGEELGRTVVKRSEGGNGTRIPRGVDQAAFWRVIKKALDLADEALRNSL